MPAPSAPELKLAEQGWACVYAPRDRIAADGETLTFVWARQGKPVPVSAEALTTFGGYLAELAPAAGGRVCTSDLGQRYIFSYLNGDDVTAVIIDDFGCRDVRLSDHPANTVPGESTQPGVSPGVLSGPEGLLIDLQALTSGS